MDKIKLDKLGIELPLKELYEIVCDTYANKFCEKHGYYRLGESPDTFWVGNNCGGILFVGDVYANFDTIRTDIDMNASEGEFIKYYDYLTHVSDALGVKAPSMNFKSWLKGAPRYTEEELNMIKQK